MRLRPLVLASLLVVVLPVPAVRAQAGAPEVTRLEARDNIGAALAWSQLAFADRMGSDVLLARDDVFADALAAGAAVGANRMPLLLTSSNHLDDRVKAELRRLGTVRAAILGGMRAMGPEIEQELEAMDINHQRIAGNGGRTATAAVLAQTFFSGARRAIVARAGGSSPTDPTQGFADALAAGLWGSQADAPILLTATDQLSPETEETLRHGLVGVQRVDLVGGRGAVSDGVRDEIAAMGLAVDRAAGGSRFETATIIAAARDLPSAAEATMVVLLDGVHPQGWAPGFAGSAAVHMFDQAAAVLSAGPDLPEATLNYLRGADPDNPPPLVCAPYVDPRACDAAAAALAGQG